jgi:hypothetical protein
MFKRSMIVLFLIAGPLIGYSFCQGDMKNPKNPDDPKITDKSEEKLTQKYNIEYRTSKGRSGKGMMRGLKGIYLKLAWDGNETGSQEVLMDFVKSIRIRSYSMTKKTQNDLGVVFYFPDLFDIEMKDGTSIKNAKGRIKEIESMTLYNTTGRQKLYTYFIRYWLEDKKVFSDNRSSNYDEAPIIPPEVVAYIEFLDQ